MKKAGQDGAPLVQSGTLKDERSDAALKDSHRKLGWLLSPWIDFRLNRLVVRSVSFSPLVLFFGETLMRVWWFPDMSKFSCGRLKAFRFFLPIF